MLFPKHRSVSFRVWLPSFFRLNFTILFYPYFSFCNAWWLLKFGSIQFPVEIPRSFYQVSPSFTRYSCWLFCLLFSFDQIKLFIQLYTPVPLGSFLFSWQVSVNLPFEFPRHSLVSTHHDWRFLFLEHFLLLEVEPPCIQSVLASRSTGILLSCFAFLLSIKCFFIPVQSPLVQSVVSSFLFSFSCSR
jgi:hypothetical protein